MRQVFTSPRLENVEAVAELLRAEGIEVRITEGRSYRGNRRSNFSYREAENAGPQPAVWILRAEDQPRGRQLLREAGLLESSRNGEGSYLPLPARDAGRGMAGKGQRAMRIKLALLALIAIVIGLVVFASRKSEPAATTTQPKLPLRPALVPQPIATPETYRTDVPTALAQRMIEQALGKSAPTQACVAIDGKDPTMAVRQPIAGLPTRIVPMSACPGVDLPRIDVSDYLTDGTGSGSVRVQVDGGTPRVFEVERDGTEWRILRTR